MRGGTPTGVGALLAVVLAATGACSAGTPDTAGPAGPAAPSTSAPATAPPTSAPATSAAPSSAAPSSAPPAPASPAAPADEPGTVPPAWLGTRVLTPGPDGLVDPVRTPPELRERRFTLPDTLPALPGTGFASRVADPAPDDVVDRSTWAPGCPVGRDDLAWVRVAFRGFDGARHTGELLVDGDVADDVVEVFAALWRADFPIEQMRITTAAELDAPPTGDGNGTGAFVCRPVVGGSSEFSQHAYGRAIDVNPFQNPYERGTGAARLVIPELAGSYLDRGDVRPGMIEPGGPVTAAFAAVGWGWGGDFRSLKDYQHFSVNGR